MFAGRAADRVSAAAVLEWILAVLLLLGVGFLAAGFGGLLAAAAAAAGVLLFFIWYRHMVLKQFGGVTGDLLGYLVQMLELIILLVLAISSFWV